MAQGTQRDKNKVFSLLNNIFALQNKRPEEGA